MAYGAYVYGEIAVGAGPNLSPGELRRVFLNASPRRCGAPGRFCTSANRRIYSETYIDAIFRLFNAMSFRAISRGTPRGPRTARRVGARPPEFGVAAAPRAPARRPRTSPKFRVGFFRRGARDYSTETGEDRLGSRDEPRLRKSEYAGDSVTHPRNLGYDE